MVCKKKKEKETVQFTSPCEPTLDPSLTKARMWADNLIVAPIICRHRPKCSRTSPAHVKRCSTCFKKSSYIWEAKFQIRRPIPWAAKDKPNASPSPSSLQPSSKQANAIPEPMNHPRRPLTRSQNSPLTKSAVPTTPPFS